VKANPTVLGGNRTVADVLNWSSLQMAGAAPGAVVKDYKAHAIQTALDMFPDDPNMQRKVEGALTRQFAAVQMDAAAQAEAQRNAAATAESGYYRQIFDPTKPFGPAELHAAENDPAFTLYPEKIKAIREASIQEAQRRAKGDEPPGDGPAYSSLFTRVVAPAGSPDKITDIDAVYPMLQSGQISPQGYGKLRAYIEGNRTQAGKNQNQALAGFLKALEPQYKKPGGLMDDPRGLEFYNQARNQAEHAFQDGIKAHIPEGDLVDPKSKDYIGNKISIKPRSLDEVLGDIRRTTGQPGAAPKLAAPAGAPSQFVEGQTYTDAKGNRATYSGGQWLPIPGGPAPGPSANLAPPVR
jgi:hypothetical protein